MRFWRKDQISILAEFTEKLFNLSLGWSVNIKFETINKILTIEEIGSTSV